MSNVEIGEKRLHLPLIQGGMGVGVSLSRLAGNVAKCGAMGVISSAQIGFRDSDFADHTKEANRRAILQEVKKAKEIAEGHGLTFQIDTCRFAFLIAAAVGQCQPVLVKCEGLADFF